MTHGLKVVNDRGSIQVDETYSNLQLTAKISTRFPSGGPYTQEWIGTRFTNEISLQLGGVQPIVFFRCGDWASLAFADEVHNNPGVWNFVFSTPATHGPVIDIWVFDHARAAPVSGSHGLTVRNAGGAVVFDSRNVSLRLMDVVTFNADGQAGSGFVYPNRTYALAHGRMRSSVLYVNRPPTFQGADIWQDLYQDFVLPTATGFRNQSFKIHENGPFLSTPGVNSYQPLMDVMLADVTGL